MKRSKALTLSIDDDNGRLAEDRGSFSEHLASKPYSLVGKVLFTESPDAPGQVVVRWRAADGSFYERRLSVMRGLEVERGDLVLLQRPSNWPEWLVTHVIQGGGSPSPDGPGRRLTATAELNVKIDGKRIDIEGRDEVVLRCGDASITLRRNGRVVVRGTYVESRSKGTNRIKGGSVLIN